MKTTLKEKYRRRKKQEKRLIIGSVIGFSVLFGSVLMYIFGVIGSHPEVMDGTWVYDNYMSFEFDGKKNGYMHLGDLEYDYSYKVRGNKLKLDFTDEAVEDCVYKFSINKNNLTLVGGEGTTGGTYELQRKQ